MIGRRHGLEEVSLDFLPFAGLLLLIFLFFVIRMGFRDEVPVAVVTADLAAPAGDPVIVAVTAAGTLQLEGKPVELGALRASVARALHGKAGSSVLLMADEGARAMMITRAVDACRSAGARSIGLATRMEWSRIDGAPRS